jgi:hypothetical protein
MEIVSWGHTANLKKLNCEICSNLTKLPNERGGLKFVTSFSSTFNNCISLKSIPDGLFDNNINVTDFYYTFQNCTSLTTIPSGLFDNNINVTNFSYTFQNCTSLTGSAPKLWNNSIWSHVSNNGSCFEDTGALGTNRTTIPIEWGGTCDCAGDCNSNCSGL